jgi:hypothetical protein
MAIFVIIVIFAAGLHAVLEAIQKKKERKKDSE